MNNLNSSASIFTAITEKVARLLTNALIRHADESVKFSFLLVISEAKFPVELMLEDK